MSGAQKDVHPESVSREEVGHRADGDQAGDSRDSRAGTHRIVRVGFVGQKPIIEVQETLNRVELRALFAGIQSEPRKQSPTQPLQPRPAEARNHGLSPRNPKLRYRRFQRHAQRVQSQETREVSLAVLEESLPELGQQLAAVVLGPGALQDARLLQHPAPVLREPRLVRPGNTRPDAQAL